MRDIYSSPIPRINDGTRLFQKPVEKSDDNLEQVTPREALRIMEAQRADLLTKFQRSAHLPDVMAQLHSEIEALDAEIAECKKSIPGYGGFYDARTGRLDHV